MTLRVAVQMDPIQSINIFADSTFIMALEAQERGHSLWTYTPDDLFLDNGTVKANGKKISLRYEENNHVTFHQEACLNIKDFDVVLLRQDPPFDMHYLTTTYLLEMVQSDVLIVNNPTAVRNFPEKIFSTHFGQITPPTLISRSPKEIHLFRAQYQDIIIKPLYGNGGVGVFHITPENENLSTLLELFFSTSREPLITQKYLPEIRNGDKRIILIDGSPVGAINRIPPAQEVRANMHVGGVAEKCDLTEHDKAICAAIGPTLKDNGLIFAGIDVIGEYLTEINVTSPTGIQEINRFDDLKVEKTLWDVIESSI